MRHEPYKSLIDKTQFCVKESLSIFHDCHESSIKSIIYDKVNFKINHENGDVYSRKLNKTLLFVLNAGYSLKNIHVYYAETRPLIHCTLPPDIVS